MNVMVEELRSIANNCEKLLEENKELRNKVELLEKIVNGSVGFMDSITPVKVYRCKSRGNTTVKFLDGSSVTVHKMKGDKDSLETAIVYALYKKIYPKKLLTNLVENATKVRKSRCKKD